MHWKMASAFILLFFSIAAYSQPVKLTVRWKPVAQKPQSDTIYYQSQRLLTWSDFAGKPIADHFAGAITSSGFGYHAQSMHDGRQIEVVVEVYVYFHKKQSWKKDRIHTTYHLAHEQRHFDITRLGAQEFFDRLKNSRLTAKNYQSFMQRLFSEVHAKNNALQDQYDRETNHSINIEKQMEWNERLHKAILALPK